MEDIQILDATDEVHLFCLHFAYIPHIRRHLSDFAQGWNNHGLSTVRKKTPLQLWTWGMYEMANSSQSGNRDLGAKNRSESVSSILGIVVCNKTAWTPSTPDLSACYPQTKVSLLFTKKCSHKKCTLVIVST